MNKAQKHYIELIKLSRFNQFNGKLVAADLITFQHLWKATIMTRSSYNHPHAKDYSDCTNLITLRDLPDGENNVDTLFLLPAKGKADELRRLVKMWNPDRIEWIGGERAADTLGSYPQKGKKVILSAWWD
jgi:hypothetical protein